MRRLPVVLLLLLVTLAVAAPATNNPTTAAQLDPEIGVRVKAAAMLIAVPFLHTEAGRESLRSVPLGSGTIVSADGIVLTNYHVIDPVALDEIIREIQQMVVNENPYATTQRYGTEFLLLGSDGDSPPQPLYYAALIASDPERDIAVLRITTYADYAHHHVPVTTETPFISFGNSDDLVLGERVQILGYPSIGGGSLTYTEGVISSFEFNWATGAREWVSTDAVMSGGSSGGTAINDAGLLIGIPTGGRRLDTGGSLGMLIPINHAITLLERNGIYINSETNSVTDLPAPPVALQPDLPTAQQPDPSVAQQPEQIVPPELEGLPAQLPSTASRPQPGSVGLRSSATGAGACSFAFERHFSDPNSFTAFDDGVVSGFVSNGELRFVVRSPGRASYSYYAGCGTGGASASFSIDIGTTVGSGNVVIAVRDDTGPEWFFNVNPYTETWSLFRTVTDTDQSFVWIEPISYSGQVVGALKSMSVVTRQGSVWLLINDQIVADSAQGLLPEMPGSLTFGFGVGMNTTTTATFEASIRRIALAELK